MLIHGRKDYCAIKQMTVLGGPNLMQRVQEQGSAALLYSHYISGWKMWELLQYL